MKVIHARNVHQALPLALAELAREGVENASRNGPVRKFDQPVTTVYARPTERVVFWAERDANPWFHFFEALWMLDGRNDVEFPSRFVSRMRSFSDDGLTFHGAYGYRWRKHFAFDQLPFIIKSLTADKTDRRQVLSMWDARSDLGRSGKDLPCNLQALFAVRADGALDMTVTNRSNDIVWGAYGANAVHFSFLHEFLASAIGVPVGAYRQVSVNFHAYLDTLAPVASLSAHATPERYAGGNWEELCPYESGLVEPYRLVTIGWEAWLEELHTFLSLGSVIGLSDPFFRKVAVPMWEAWLAWKTLSGPERYRETYSRLGLVKATDWRLATLEWVARREVRSKSGEGYPKDV